MVTDSISLRNILSRAEQLSRALSDQQSLTPSPRINELFEELVSLACSQVASHEIELERDPSLCNLCSSLHPICADGETMMELHWSERIAKASDPWEELRQFPYYNNYVQLSALEFNALKGVGAESSKITWVGSGPLPLSAIILAKNYGLTISCIERNPDAHRLSVELLEKLGLKRQISVVLSSIEELDRLDDHSVVLVGAMVNSPALSKRELFRTISSKMVPGQFIAVRTVHSLRCLLYPPVRIQDLADFAIQCVVHPYNDVVNSVIVGNKSLQS